MELPTGAIRVLHVDDNAEFADTAAAFLERDDDRFEVETASRVEDGLDRLAAAHFDCVVSDYEMPGQNGIEFLETVREEHGALPFILYTGKGSEEVASEAISAGVTEYLQKERGTGQYKLLANRIRQAVEKQYAKTELAEREKRLALFFEESPMGVVEWDENFDFVRLNETAEEILGYDEAELQGESWETIVPESEREPVGESVSNLLAAKGGQHSINENVRKDGRRIVCEWHNRVVTDDTGDVITIFSQFQDITARERRRTELQQYETIINSLTDAVYVLDEEGRFTYVSDELVELVGYDRDRLLGSEPTLLKEQAAVERAEDNLGELLSSDGPDSITFEITLHPRDGDPIVCEDHMGVLPYDGDEFNGSVGTLRDITARKARERELERKNARLEEFTSVVSHDLRNPLNVAQGRVELAQAECDSEHLDEAADALDRSQVLIEDLLTLAREGNQVDDIETVELETLTEECWHTVAADEATVSVTVDTTVRADRSRLTQLLENLYRNAIEHGGDDVTVTVGPLPDGFYVEDDGPGIPPEAREDVFEAGYSTTDNGTGFGLSIVKRVVDAHGWEIAVTESEAGGARFEITGITFSDK
ncbi:MAG: PAS domain S-box protein [Halapricum sp.]